MYIKISRKNFKQDISEQKLQTKYVHRHFKCIAGCPALGLYRCCSIETVRFLPLSKLWT